MDFIENRTFGEIAIGDTARIERTLTRRDIELFAVMSGDVNPTHLDTEYAEQTDFHQIIGHGMWGGALISSVLGTQLPGPGTIYLDQSLRFENPVGVGDTVCVRVTATEKQADTGRVVFDCRVSDADDATLISGTATVRAPREKVRRPRAVLPEVTLHSGGGRFRALIERTRAHDPVPTAVVHPCDAESLRGALMARDETIIAPILVGPRARIEATAAEAGLSLDGLEIVDVAHSHAAAERSVQLVHEGRAGALMKGKLHTDELLSGVLDRNTGLRTERRLSHVFALDVPGYPRTLMVTDAAINITPDLETLADIVRNAIELAGSMGTELPRVALLSAIETVNARLPSTLNAAAICKMHDRGQISGGLVDGPLAFDNAISASAARAKGIDSAVAGRADVLVAPNLESGNMIAKQLIHMAGAESAGIALGARVPIMLTSRSDNAQARLASAALAQLHAMARRAG